MENAGKSTIVNILTKGIDINLRSPPDMDPTRGVEKGTLLLNEKDIAIWDFGGQESYRSDYMNNPDRYFKMVSYFFFVIDCQDYYRYVTSAMYFSGILQLIKRFSSEAKIVLLFHKMDPNFDPTIKSVKKQFLEKVEPVLKANNTPFLCYDTTIYNFGTIKNAFSQI